MSQKVALVLSSGGPRGFAYIGAIEELEHVKGDKVIDALKEIVPDIDIENLKIPYCAVATDFYTGEEVVFKSGKLFQAIRASISIPSLFRPAKVDGRTLIDGGITNVIPLNRVARTGDDIMVAFDVNAIDIDRIKKISQEDSWDENNLSDPEKGFHTVLGRTFSLMNLVNTRLSLKITPPDILVSMPFDEYGAIPDYAKAREISQKGRELMRAALDEYEAKRTIPGADKLL